MEIEFYLRICLSLQALAHMKVMKQAMGGLVVEFSLRVRKVGSLSPIGSVHRWEN